VSDAPNDLHAQIKVSGRVLIQLGSELVTDVEQALLECVKNAYDADSPGCEIDIDTNETGTIEDIGAFGWLGPFKDSTESVIAKLTPEYPTSKETEVTRQLTYTGRITIKDSGDGISESDIRKSWLVVSNSGKRASGQQPKEKTFKGRTPLGDKGLGRLGTMKLGDILHVESAQSPEANLSRAHFRWKDCEVAQSIDLVPVITSTAINSEGFKGTRVSVFGLHDIANWRRANRPAELISSLAGLISPFESASTFPVVVKVDGADYSLVRFTDEALNAAVAKFTYSWEDFQGKRRLLCRAYFKKALFTTARSQKQLQRNQKVFNRENADVEFMQHLRTYRSTKGYALDASPGNGWYFELERTYGWSDCLLDSKETIEDPGVFHGEFYFFHIDKSYFQQTAVVNADILAPMVKKMAGISILRDGFRVRSTSDWLGVAEGMTSGSSYGMRYSNTVGFFSLTGERNYLLVEKSDREGFVDNAAYRGFHSIARTCLKFANESLESVRRAVDDRAKDLKGTGDSRPTTAQSVKSVENIIKTADSVRESAGSSAQQIQQELDNLLFEELSFDKRVDRATAIAERAVGVISTLHQSLRTETAADAMQILRKDLEDQREIVTSLIESAAIGLSARGLTHELRTHLTEIRQRLAAIQSLVKKQSLSQRDFESNIRAIKASCSAISGQASLLDPMLPRTRAVKDTFDVYSFIKEYADARRSRFDREGIEVKIVGQNDSLSVRMNRARLLQVLDNLVNNSIYWLNRAELTGDLKSNKVIEIVATPRGFVVSDSGMGIEPHYELSLFDMFVSAKPQSGTGQGLGLFISRQLLAMDGCGISLDPARNSFGRMYRFVVDLGAVDARK